MMKHQHTLLLAGLLSAGILLSGCGGSEDSTAAGGELRTTDICGTWVQTLSDGTETITFKADMTYDKTIRLTGDVPMTTETHDNWSLTGDTIRIHYTDYGQVSDYTVSIDGNTMTWETGDSRIIYQKKQ